MALQDDCIRWHLELSNEDPFYEVEKRVLINEQTKRDLLEEKGLGRIELFCLPTVANQIPRDFITMLSILKGKPVSTIEERKMLLLESIREKMQMYVTLMISDRTRSRLLFY